MRIMPWTMDDYLYYIIKQTKKHNIDNVTRTNAYQKFYFTYPEIQWTLVATIVSRNAGWNMTDLYLPPYKDMLGTSERIRLFMTYERANWLIFSDTYPQLLVYQLSLSRNEPMFHLLDSLHVSHFMKKEWEHFWTYKNKQRLMDALIINEQHVIERPVVQQPFFKQRVFKSLPYILQNYFMMNAVLVPTTSKRVYGKFVHGFTNVHKRIMFGKQIAAIIYSPKIYQQAVDFLLTVSHTGSRRDYEQFLNVNLPQSPILRLAYPAITHHDEIRNDWAKCKNIKKKWFSPLKRIKICEMSSRFYLKRHLLYAYSHMKRIFS